MILFEHFVIGKTGIQENAERFTHLPCHCMISHIPLDFHFDLVLKALLIASCALLRLC